MTTHADDLYEDETEFHSTPEVARGAEISESSARSFATEIGVPRIGPAFAWNKVHYEELLTLVDDDDDEEEESNEEADEADEGEMVQCANCDAEVDDSDAFCAGCGADLSDDDDV